ncbi:calumenin-A-like [Xenia sp. Carnegie-2017]|uniref:calumenin-A-like n=1 Tax=Xenia sp. Carnegie-2017 TaxID=2897299 RepID=UPI001F03EC2A|nr:calumenin-A-like [Xenia sp. Carnegie-2017]
MKTLSNLGKLQRIDVNKDGRITTHEMENWIESNMKRYSLKNTNDRLKEWDMNKDDHISWNEYVARYSVANSPKKKNILDSEKRRFDKADMNGDGKLSREELIFFLHLEESSYMTDVVAEENLEALDTNNDGLLSLKEFSGGSAGRLSDLDLYATAGEFAPLDKNKDGKLSKDELAPWVLPNDAYTVSNEAMHLLSQADLNRDHVLTYDEVVNRYEAFVGSKATHFGKLLKPNPDL